MSIGTDAGSPESEGLQFDRAEFDQAAPAAVSCAACKRPIDRDYYEINGVVVCEACRSNIEGQLRGGSGFVRFVRAVAFGSVAAVVGVAAYAGFIKATNVDFALVSIFVGYLIGRAVRAGSWDRGGWLYQILAVGQTYLAIGVTHVVVLLWGAELVIGDAQTSPILKAAAYLGIAAAVPVFMMKESVISIAIIGFALWQAWKMNVRRRLVVTGPYRVGEPGPGGPIGEAPADA